jgi:DNA-binding MarR family transcriptional regulator
LDHLIQLLTDFRDFKRETGSESFPIFGEWLKQKYAQAEQFQTDEPTVNEAGVDVIASYLIGGITGYVETWIKLTYDGLPLHSLGDFSIMKSVEQLGSPSKKEIAARVIMEHSTCIESIKRLIRSGLLREKTDVNDKRLKRVMLTDAGVALLTEVDKKMMGLGTLLMGNLSETEKRSLIPILSKLNDFHRDLYRNKDTVDIRQLYHL